MSGLPTIIAGAFVVGLIVEHHGQSAFAAGVALSIVEVPLIARATIEALRRVPGTMREAADALGVAHWRTVIGVILPTASNGIVTATILAVARAAGETAPVLLHDQRLRAELPAQPGPRGGDDPDGAARSAQLGQTPQASRQGLGRGIPPDDPDLGCQHRRTGVAASERKETRTMSIGQSSEEIPEEGANSSATAGGCSLGRCCGRA